MTTSIRAASSIGLTLERVRPLVVELRPVTMRVTVRGPFPPAARGFPTPSRFCDSRALRRTGSRLFSFSDSTVAASGSGTTAEVATLVLRLVTRERRSDSRVRVGAAGGSSGTEGSDRGLFEEGVLPARVRSATCDCRDLNTNAR